MPSRLQPPTFPLRKVDDNSQYIATSLVMAYPMLEGGGDTITNYGSWGGNANLTLTGATWTKRETGLSSLDFSASQAVAKNTSMAQNVPDQWTWATWLKLDSTPVGTTPKELFSFRSASGTAQVRAWADGTGIWSWQKSSTADDYSVLSPSYFPTTGPMLIISTFAGNNLAPVQLATNIGMRSIPTQPVSYAAFNVGQGPQATTLDGFYIGNDNTSASPWDGTIGPFYFWNRVLTNSEVWALWQDPYAPFRRNSSDFIAPTLMRGTSGFSLNGLAKTSGPKTIIQDQNSLFIVVDDYYFYQDSPIDTLTPVAQTPVPITIDQNVAYVALPVDTLSPPEFLNILIDITDSFTFVAMPVDNYISGNNPTIPIVDITDSFTYATFITDSLVSSTQGPLSLDISDNYTPQIGVIDSVSGSTS